MIVRRKYLKNVESVLLCFSYEHVFPLLPVTLGIPVDVQDKLDTRQPIYRAKPGVKDRLHIK